jgi:signal transduction histidine kinase
LFDVPGFRAIAELHSSTTTVVARAIREHDGLPVVLKWAAGEPPARRHQAALLNELGILAELDVPQVSRAHGIVRARDRLVLVTDYFDGVPLEQFFAAAPVSTTTFVAIATALARALAGVHARDIVHNDIAPENILVAPATREIRLIDFGRAVRGVRASRSDLQALGVTLARVLVGIRAPGLAAIVDKLAAPDLAARYQTAAGLLWDLERCARDPDAVFPLGAHDVAPPPVPPSQELPRQSDAELQLAHKLESVARLAAGVAHEINTPLQYVRDSVAFLQSGIGDVFRVLGEYRALRACSPLLAEVAELEDELDIAYLAEQVPAALDRACEGITRVATLVRSLKDFAPESQRAKLPADINRALAATIAVARNEYKDVADIRTRFGVLPLVPCHLSELNACFLNLFINAAQAIGDTGRRGMIEVATRVHADAVVISIADTGGGIPEHVRGRIFDPFFTTKELGHGTGQGLAIARTIIVDKHGGSIGFDTEVGRGTTFHVRLPLTSA